MISSQIAAITIGLVLFSVISTLGVYYILSKHNKSPFSNESIFFVKKWLYIFFVILVNALGCTLVYYTRNLQVILYIILVLKSKDIIMALMFPINVILRYWRTNRNNVSQDSESGVGNNIVAFVPVYTESKTQITRTLQSIVGAETAQSVGTIDQDNNTLLFLVSDGSYNYDYLIDDVKLVHDSSYTSWKNETIDISVSYGFHNGSKIVIVRKNKNMGKKDSIILCHNIFNFGSHPEIRNHIKTVFGIPEFHYILGVDADTIVSSNSITSLVHSITSRNAVASCGIVNADKSQGNLFWNNLQNFQYLYGQYMRRTNEDLFNQVLCLPGCISMFKIDEKLKVAFDEFSEIPDGKGFVLSSVQYVGTDRRLTSLFLSSGNRIVLDTNTHAYTCVPSSLSAFVKQRTRWCQNMYFNTLINIFAPNINFLLRLFNFIDFLRFTLIYFRLFNTVYFIFLLASFYNSTDFIQLLPYIVIICYPVVLFLIYSLFDSHLRSQYLSLLVSLILNKIFSLFSTITIFTIMVFNIGNHTW
jgi:chitin synthase